MAAFSFRGGVGGGGEGSGNGDAAAAVASMMSHQAARSDAEFSGIAAFPPRPRVRRCTRTPRRPSLLLRQRTATTTAGSPLEPASAAAR
jgi:hypothetical protein